MKARPAVLGAIICVLIFTSGCIDVAVTSSVNGAGELERHEMTLSMTGTVYAMMVQSATSGGYASVEEMIEHPRDQTGPDPAFDYRETWDRDTDRVTMIVTARNPNAMREKKDVSVVRDGDYLVYREDMSALAGSSSSSQAQNPYASQLGSMFTVRYTLTMPGEIVESNADTINGNTAEWHRSTSTAPMIYAKSKVSPFPVGFVAGAGAVLLLALGIGGVVLYRRSRRGPLPPADAARWEPVPTPVRAVAPAEGLEVRIAEGVTYRPTARPDVVRVRPTAARIRPRSGRTLQYALVVGAVILVALIAGATIDSFLSAGSPAASTAVGVPAVATPIRAVPTPATLPPGTAAPARAANAPGSSTPLRIDGAGDDVAVFTASGADLRIFSMQHTGSSWFFVEVIDAEGGIDFLASQYGQYSGRATDWLDGGQYTLQVRADGPWTVEISPAVGLVSGPGRKSLPASTKATLPPGTVPTAAPIISIGTVSDPIYSAPPQQPPQQPTPRYRPGDIVNDRPTNQGTAWMILGYDPGTDEYDWCIVHRYDDGHWGYRLTALNDWHRRTFVEDYYATLITHVDPNTVPIGYPASDPPVVDPPVVEPPVVEPPVVEPPVVEPPVVEPPVVEPPVIDPPVVEPPVVEPPVVEPPVVEPPIVEPPVVDPPVVEPPVVEPPVVDPPVVEPPVEEPPVVKPSSTVTTIPVLILKTPTTLPVPFAIRSGETTPFRDSTVPAPNG